jgi:glycogen operon protein
MSTAGVAASFIFASTKDSRALGLQYLGACFELISRSIFSFTHSVYEPAMATTVQDEGSPSPLGASYLPFEQAYNFALYSRFATAVKLLVFGPDDFVTPLASFTFDPLQHKTVRVWHMRVAQSDLKGALYYAYQVDGPPESNGRFERHAFNKDKILLDPYARAVFIPPAFDRTAASGQGSNAGKAPLGILPPTDPIEADPHPRPRLRPNDLIIYELHVRGFTNHPTSGVSSAKRGTFAGLVDKIPYLKDLGVNALELLPVSFYDRTEPNYWGYQPLNFFAPHPDYSSDRKLFGPIHEFRAMVKALHEAGIEVLLDVVYNHTGEGNQQGPTFSFKGIDNSTYYIGSEDDQNPYTDFSGCGNTFQNDDRAARRLVIDSLRNWTTINGADGFRFDLASVFTRRRDESVDSDDPPIFGDFELDPAIRENHLIGEPWEGNFAHPNYLLGTPFPGFGWRLWNDKFRETVRAFVRGDGDKLKDLMTRLHGSTDVFPDNPYDARRPYQSINYISSHDGLTLYDLTAYNGGDSWNCGPDDEANGEQKLTPEIMKTRQQQVKNLFALLMLSNGTPMFRAGDEFMQTQGGEGNPYNIDSEVSWLNWSRLETHRDVHRFVKLLIAFRKSHPSIGRSTFWREDIKWHGTGKDINWDPDSHWFSYILSGGDIRKRDGSRDNDIYVMVNLFWEPLDFTIQEGVASDWRLAFDTSADSPQDIPDNVTELSSNPPLSSLKYTVKPRSVAVFVK